MLLSFFYELGEVLTITAEKSYLVSIQKQGFLFEDKREGDEKAAHIEVWAFFGN